MAVVVNTRSPSDSRYTLKLNITPRSPDIANNSTVVDWSLVLSFSGTLTYGRYWSGSDISYSVAINGSTVKSGKYTYDFRRYSTLTIASGSTTINHNSDGSKTLSASCSAQMYTPQVIKETISGSGSLTLPTIPRASTPTLSANSVVYGNAVTIYTNRKSSTFTHRIRANWNGTAEIIASDVATSFSWTVPLKYLNRIPNARSTSGILYLDTYNGSTLIGTKSTRLTTTAPSNIGPNIGTVTLSEAVSGLATQFGAYIQGKSKIKVSGTATGQYSASIKSYQIQINDETSGGATYTSGYLKYSGTRQVIFRATDSRGFTSSKTVSYSALAYTPPRILAFNAFRSNASGMADPQGTYALAQYKASITSLNSKNTKAYKIRYRPVDTTTWTEITLNNDSYTPNSSRVLPSLDAGKSYEIQFVASDYFSSASFSVKVSTIAVTMDFRAGGKGVAFGKVSEKDAFEVGMPVSIFTTDANVLKITRSSPHANVNLVFENDIQTRYISFKDTGRPAWSDRSDVNGTGYDFWTEENSDVITESGSNPNGRYVRFSDGTQICSLNYLISSVPVTDARGGMYGTLDDYTWTYPANFSAYPSVSGLCTPSSGGDTFVVGAGINNVLYMSYRIAASHSATIPTVRVALTAVGRWK